MRLALPFTFFLAVVATWPMPLSPGGALLGHPGNDVWNHVWGYWWVAEEARDGYLPLRTGLMGFPEERRLFFIDTFGAVVTLPIQLLFGPVAAYNAAVFASFHAAGLAAWALARHVLTRLQGAGRATDVQALFAAIAYTFSPHLLAQAYNGITETLNAFGLPLAILGVMRFYERPSFRTALVAALFGSLCILANWYYGLFAVLAAALWLVSEAIFRRERLSWRALPIPGGAAAALVVVLVGPVLAGFSWTLDGDDALVSRDPEFVWKQLVTHNVTDVLALLHPGRYYSPDLKALHGEDLLIVVYLGWALIAAAILGLSRMKRWRDRLPWLVWIGFFGVLTLGPHLYIDGGNVLWEGRKIPLPFLALFDLVPVFQRISHPFRFVMAVQLALGVLGAMGMGRLGRAAPVLAFAVAVEFLVASPAPWPLPRSSAALPASNAILAADPVEGAVLDLPATVPNLERAVYLYWQTGHGRPSPYALNEPLPDVLGRSRLVRTLMTAEAARIDRLPPELPELDLVASGRALSRLGFRYIVLHGRLYPEDRREIACTILRIALGPEDIVTAEEQHIWTLREEP